MATARAIIGDVFNTLGIPNPTTKQYEEGLRKMNNLFGQLSARFLFIPVNTVENLTLVVGQSDYTIGTGGNFNTTRPSAVDYAQIRDANNQDHDLIQIYERDFLEIWDKNISNRPTEFYFAEEYPLAKIRFNFKPVSAETLILSSQKPLSSVAALDDTVNLPDVYKLFIEHKLVRLLAPGYGWTPDANFLDLARESEAAVVSKRASKVPDKKFDPALTYRDGNRQYDIKQG